MKTALTTTEKQTVAAGKSFAQALTSGCVVGLVGPLGAGKTAFAKGLAQGLGVTKTVTSPTFIIMNVYATRPKTKKSTIKTFVHIDCYRLKTAGDLLDIGAQQYFNRPDTVVAIEWADRVKKILPKGSTVIQFIATKTGRKISWS